MLTREYNRVASAWSILKYQLFSHLSTMNNRNFKILKIIDYNNIKAINTFMQM